MKINTSQPIYKKVIFNLLIGFLFVFLLYFQISQFYPRGLLLVGADTQFHLTRMLGIANALQDGSFPFYINSAYLNGYGYAANWFYPDLFLIPASVMYNLGIHLIKLVKIYYIMLSVATFASMYYCTNKITKNKYMSVISAFLYTFCQYRAIDLYWRFSIGESLAFIFLPIIFYGCYEVFNGNPKKWYILTLGFSGMLYSHLISTLLAFIMLLIYMVFSYKNILKNKRRIAYLFLAGIVTILIGTFQLFPMLEQILSNTFVFMKNKLTYPTDNVYITNQLFKSAFFFASINSNKSIAYGIGYITILPLFARFFIKRRNNDLIVLADSLLFISVIFFVFTTNIFPWKYIHILDYVQFPWRFNLIISYTVSLSVGIYIVFLIGKEKLWHLLLLMILILTLAYTYYSAYLFRNYVNPTYAFFVYDKTSREQIYTYDIGGGKEYLPIIANLDYIMKRGKDYITLSSDDISITNYKETSNKLSFNFKSNESNVYFVLPKVWYKGYVSYLNGVEVENTMNYYDGLVYIYITESDGYIELVYESTTIQEISFYVSIFSFSLLIVGIVYINIKREYSRKLT